MLHYPKIVGSQNAPLGRCIAFEKYDGSNLHWDWDRDFSWHSFGPRRGEFNLTADGIAHFCEEHGHLAEAVAIFQSTLAAGIEKILREQPDYQHVQACKVFTEFFGPNSIAGLHQAGDVKELRLFDVQIEGLGMLGPARFRADFGELPIARTIYEGRITGNFLEDVRCGKYSVAEGVVCKGGTGGADLWMIKVKKYAYLERLKQAFAERWEEYWE